MTTTVLFLAVFACRSPPAFGEDVSERIRTIEQELEQLKAQQIELKKEATAAAAAMPSFSYRPGNGLTIESADKAWGLRMGIETHFRMLFESGRDQVGRSNGELMGRRFRPYIYYCIDNCLWELEAILDLDGFGTGNGKDALSTTVGSILHRGALNAHFENLHPWLPTVQLGMDVSSSIGTARQGSSSVGAQAEYDLLSRINGGQFHRDRILLREWDLFYFIAPRMSVGAHVLWYDASNLRNGRNNAAHNLSVCDTPVSAPNCRSGIGGDWVDVMLNYRYQF